jgi:hypothetical protein
MLISDQPILEFLVRSTTKHQYHDGGVGVTSLALVVLPLLDILKIKDTGIVVVLAREYDVVEISRVSVGDGVACPVSDSSVLPTKAHTAGVVSSKA